MLQVGYELLPVNWYLRVVVAVKPPGSVAVMVATVKCGNTSRGVRQISSLTDLCRKKSLRTVINITLPTTFRNVPLDCGSCARHVAR